MHRTASVDYGIVLEGEITLVLDDSEVTLRAGDIVVQRGTDHAWANRGDVTARVVFVLVDGEFDEELAAHAARAGSTAHARRSAGLEKAATIQELCSPGPSSRLVPSGSTTSAMQPVGHGHVDPQLVAVEAPRHGDPAVRRQVLGLGRGDPAARARRHPEPAPGRLEPLQPGDVPVQERDRPRPWSSG